MGEVVLVGAGPGDPGLLTIRGLEELRRADVVLYDRLAPRELLNQVPSGVELVPVGKAPGRHSLSQDEINNLLVGYASQGLRVVRLKGGDPYVFGRGEEECLHVIARGLPCRVVPGVPSFVGAGAYGGIPLAGRGFASSFAVATGRLAAEKGDHVLDYSAMLRAVDQLVVLMGVGSLESILSQAEAARGPRHPAAVVMDATLPSQRILVGTVSSLRRASREGAVRPPAVLFVGRGVEWGERLWRTGAVSYY